MMEARKGTTIVGIRGEDYIVIAGERQATAGFMVASYMKKKVYPIYDYMVWGASGVVGDIQFLKRFIDTRVRMLTLEEGERPDPKAVATYLSTVLNYTKFFPYFVGIVLGGFKQEPYLASIDEAGGLIDADPFTVSGSGSYIAVGVLEDSWKEGLPKEEATELAVRAIKAATKRDIGSGGIKIDVGIVDASGVTFKEFDL